MPLGDGHGPDAPKHPAQRFLTTPEQTARAVALVEKHSNDLDAILDPIEQATAAILIANKAVSTLANIAELYPPLASPASFLRVGLARAESAMRGEADA